MNKPSMHQARVYSKFSIVLDQSIYEPLPDDWLIGITDVVNSTAAIRNGRYEDVNFAGVSVVAALGNALGTFDFPFTFGGDGAAFALPAHGRVQAIEALQQISFFARNDLGMELRTGLLTISEIRANGYDVRTTGYAASKTATYAMFSGGGIRWAEREVKNGRYAVAAATSLAVPDLRGLSCDWTPFPSRHGMILSLLVEPRENTDAALFTVLARSVVSVFETGPRGSNPVPDLVPVARRPETRVDPGSWSLAAANSDFRKFDDLLRLTVDCSAAQVMAVEKILKPAAARGEIDYGLHRQSHAIMTCLVPSADPEAHLHFVDGMDGGYTKAAEMLRATAKGRSSDRMPAMKINPVRVVFAGSTSDTLTPA